MDILQGFTGTQPPVPLISFGGVFLFYFFIGATIGTCQEIHGLHLGGHWTMKLKPLSPSIRYLVSDLRQLWIDLEKNLQ